MLRANALLPAAAVAVVVVACAAMSSCLPRREDSVRIDPALAALVPGDTTLLVGVRIESLKDSYLWKKYIQGTDIPRPNEFVDEFIKVAGLDPRQDIYETLFAADGKHSVVMARGKFSPEGGLEPRLDLPGAQRTTYKTYTLTVKDGNAIVFMNPSVAVAGSLGSVKAIIDNRGQSTGIPRAMAAVVDGIPASNQVWVVSSTGFPDLKGDAGSRGGAPAQLENVMQFLRTVESLHAAADLRSGLNLTVVANCADETGARHLNDGLRGLIGFGRLQSPDNQPELLRIYDAVHVSLERRDVVLTANLEQAQLEKLSGEIQRLLGKASRK